MSVFTNFFSNDGVYTLPEVSAKKSSPDTAIIGQLDELAAHTVQLYHTNSLASGAIETVTLNTVATGLKLQSKINYKYLGLTEEQAIEMQAKIENVFNMVANSTYLDIMGLHDFKQLQEIAHRTMKMTGGTLVLFPTVENDANFKLKIKLLEAQHLANKDNKADTELIAGGIELDTYGAVSKYHILKNHPNGYVGKKEWVTIPRKSGLKYNVLHLYEQKRAGQRRGIPYIASVLDIFRKINDYSEAELDAAILNARFAGFVFNENPPMVEDDETTTPEPMTIKKGNLIQLQQGWKIHFADPARPNVNFTTFLEGQIKMMCIGLHIPYELFMKHFEASYSASRGAIIEGKKYFYSQRYDLATMFCQPVFENVMLQFVLDGTLDLAGFLTDPLARLAWLGTEWVGDVQEELDPLKAVNAAEARVKSGFSTRDREAKQINGTDFGRNIETANDETTKLEKSGLPYIGTNKKEVVSGK